jgi:hypothetical protein
MVRDASAYIVVIGRKYGQIPVCPNRNDEELSITELEFNEAQRINRPILMFLMGDDHLVRWFDVETDPAKMAKLNAFRERAKRIGPDSQVHRVYATFDSLEDFAVKAVQAVAELRRYLDKRAESSTQPLPVHSTSAPIPPIPHELPPAADEFFGRQGELERLIQRLPEHTLEWLFERSVRGLNDVATRVLAAAGLLAHAPFPVQAIDAALHNGANHDEKATRQALRTLVQRGLLRLTDDDRRQFTHVLGYRFARKETGSDPELRMRLRNWLHEQLARALAVGAEKSEPASIIPLLEHLSALVRADEEQSLWKPLVEDTLYDFTDRLTALGRLGQVRLALDACRRVVRSLSRRTMEEPDWLRERCALAAFQGNVPQAQGDLMAARNSYQQSLEMM